MHAPHNKARGEVLIAIDGAPRRLCLTLGALAELEAAFDLISFAELGERLKQLTASDLILVLAALTGGGGAPMSTAELARARIDPGEAAAKVAEAFRAAFDEA
ncbi:MAG: gene transfer agent family protein [Terricaulis sp.]|nr:gene transfer agent family protein [Terricaulis sp.]